MKDWPSHKTFCEKNRGGSKEACNQSDTASIDANNSIRQINTGAVVLGNDKNNEETDERKESLHETENNVNESNKDTDTNGIPFDTRPYLPVTTVSMAPSSSYRSVAKLAVEHLNLNGYCVIDGLFTDRVINKALRDMHKCEESGYFKTGMLAGGRTSGEDDKKVVNAGIRNDRIVWVEGTEDDTPGIRDVMTKLDNILVEFNELLDGIYYLTNRTKVDCLCN